MATETVNGATLLAQTLKRAGDQPIFTLSGRQVLPIYDVGLDAGQPGIALVTAAPGFTNALTLSRTCRASWLSSC